MRKAIEDFARDQELDLLFLDQHDNAIIGIARQFNTYSVAYSKKLVIDNLCLSGDMERDEALEFFEFNIVGAYVGEHTPTFIEDDSDF
jgi:hypothetical protein